MRSACVHAHLSLQANEISFNWRAVLARIALKISTVVASSKASCLMASTSDAELFSSEEGSRAASPEIPLTAHGSSSESTQSTQSTPGQRRLMPTALRDLSSDSDTT